MWLFMVIVFHWKRAGAKLITLVMCLLITNLFSQDYQTRELITLEPLPDVQWDAQDHCGTTYSECVSGGMLPCYVYFG